MLMPYYCIHKGTRIMQPGHILLTPAHSNNEHRTTNAAANPNTAVKFIVKPTYRLAHSVKPRRKSSPEFCAHDAKTRCMHYYYHNSGKIRRCFKREIFDPLSVVLVLGAFVRPVGPAAAA